MIIVDSREKKWSHIAQYFDKHSVPYKVEKLDTGDYAAEGHDSIVVDRKSSLDEVASNLLTNDSNRFWREIRRSRVGRIKLIVLVECGSAYRNIKDVASWNSKYSIKITGRRLMEEMYRTHISYGVEWIFCDKRSSGRKIIELLGGAMK